MRSSLAALLAATAALGTPLDDYVNKADDNYKWTDTKQTVKMLSGATGHLLNVTSQKWLDESRAVGPNGALWTHQVLVVVPKQLRVKDRGFIWITGGCNEHPGLPKATDEEPLAVDLIAEATGSVGVVLFQIPNCHIVYPSDPQRRPRSEDAMIAWAWNEFLKTRDPEWLPRFPMVKASMRAMQAVQEWAKQEALADIDGWVASGASKRGWTTWMVGAVDCPSCPNIVGIAPIVPIVPALQLDMHHMFKAYGGWTFAFNDYMDVNLTRQLDTEGFEALIANVDPIKQPFLSRLGRIPKHVVVSSDDEFMMMEWTNLWWDQMPGEKHLTIANNAEHSMATGVFEMLETLVNTISSIYHNGTRPSWSFTVDQEAGEFTVRIPQGQEHGKVVLRHAQTISKVRRDFRWARLANPENGNCTLPEIHLKKPILFGANCIEPIVWTGTTLNETAPGEWKVKVDAPASGWKGYYVEAYFPSDRGIPTEYRMTTPGMVWPNTYPHADCTKAACTGHLV
eukprot:TRINITY_DN1280_c0_g1_i1.p1 TRINITY_DN1280_c0_g1~~TRINITY_DN1280_c0_g1_i1.p1  ORF type:complete len:532 (+),score=208.14 TRINITY_DN1280_c0_g1_i1:67-1596(+)